MLIIQKTFTKIILCGNYINKYLDVIKIVEFCEWYEIMSTGLFVVPMYRTADANIKLKIISNHIVDSKN